MADQWEERLQAIRIRMEADVANGRADDLELGPFQKLRRALVCDSAYLAERFDRGFYAFQECRAHIDRPPSEYWKEFYYDTVNFDPRCLELALDFAGPSQILAGSDYPHQIGSLEKMLESINKLEIRGADRDAILGGNTARLLGLDV